MNCGSLNNEGANRRAVSAGENLGITISEQSTKTRAQAITLFMVWRDDTLLDENGEARPGRQAWADYLNLPLSK